MYGNLSRSLGKLNECLVSPCIAGFSGKPTHEIISSGGDHIIFDMPCTWI